MMTLIEIGYGLVAAGYWRMLTGHFAWEAHKSDKNKTTLRPRVETWFACSIPAAALAAFWPLTSLFVLKWPWKKGAEAKAEIAMTKIQGITQLQLAEARYAALEAGADYTEEELREAYDAIGYMPKQEPTQQKALQGDVIDVKPKNWG